MQFRYHPVIENLKVNEDGSQLLLGDKELRIYADKLPHMKRERRVVSLCGKMVNTIRLVCECWHGSAPTGEHAARRIDETKGDHYSNLAWGKKGMTISAAKTNDWNNRGMSMTPKLFAKIQKRIENEKVTVVLKELKVSQTTYYNYRKKHVEKDK